MSKTQVNKNHFWNWAGNPDSRELYLYGTIAEQSWFDDDVTPEIFRNELISGTGPVTVWLNSYGGDCIAASQIYSMLIDYSYDVTVKIDGIAASAASVIAMAGKRVLMSPTACIMIHDPMTAAIGNAADMEKAIRMLESVKESIIDAYELKTGLDRKTLAKMMSEETWMDCHKAVELGFADDILEKEAMPMQDCAVPVFFSQRTVDMALVNKLAANAGVPVQPLYERLIRLKDGCK